MNDKKSEFKYPGKREAMDGNTAVIMCEREASDAAGAYPITPSTQMGEYWAEAAAAGHINISDKPLIFIEPEGEHAAAAVTAGLSMTGLRSCNFSSGQGIAYMHESLYAAVGKRLTYVLNMGCRAMTKSTLNVHAGHDDYHAVDDTGFFQLMGKDVQEVCDLNIIAHRIAELSLNPGIIGQDGFLTTHLIESMVLPERELIAEYLGRPDDVIECPTPAQRLMFGPMRRRIPELWDVDNPVMAGTVQNQDAYMQSVASQRPFFFDHIAELTDQAMDEFSALTGRRYRRVSTYRADDAEYLLVGQGSCVPTCEVVADYLRETRGVKVGVVNLTMFRPFPGDMLAPILKGKKAVCVMERCDQPLAEDLPIVREVRAALNKCIENGRKNGKAAPYPKYDTFKNDSDLPALYSASYGMGSRDLQPEGIIGAVENMLPDGKNKKFGYLSIDFIHDKPFTPKQEVYQQQIIEGYPEIKDLALRGSENPNLMPEGAITVRFHSIGGWGAITTGKNLAMTLFDLLGYHIKANPKYGSEKKGQPTTFYLSAAPEPIRVNCEYLYVDVVLSPDPNVFNHTNALSGLKKGGVFIIQSEYEDPADVWKHQFPERYQKMVVDNDIQVFYVNGFKIARETAPNPELEFRMQGIAFMGAFFAASPVMQQAKLTDEQLMKAIEDQLEHKFGSKGRRIVDDNMTVVKRGFKEMREVTDKKPVAKQVEALPVKKEAALPMMLKQLPASQDANTDIHRFWEQTGNFYLTGQGNENLADPFIAMSCLPASTGTFRDMTGIRFSHPEWIPENCTGCGNCWTVCPDCALPGLVTTVADAIETAIKRVEKQGNEVKHLRRQVHAIEKGLRDRMNAGTEKESVNDHLKAAVEDLVAKTSLTGDDKASLEEELGLLMEVLGQFKFANTKPYYSLKEKDQAGSGGLLSVTVDPWTCKGCAECIEVCPDNAIQMITQTPETIEQLRTNWDYWTELPTTKGDYIRVDDLDEGVGALESVLLDKGVYKSIVCGDGACLGCGEKTVVHLFTSMIEALMMPRVKARVQKLEDLTAQMEKHIRLKLAESVDVGNTKALDQAMSAMKDKELTLSNLTAALDANSVAMPLDEEWLKRTTQILAKLKHLHWQYTQGVTGRGRASCGMLNATGCTSVWGSTYPYNPYPFPWANHLFQDCASMAMGVFEGHMAKMAEGFKAVRMAEIELDGGYNPAEHDEKLRYFNWQHFTDEEYLLCPPVVAVGGDGALYDIGFQNLSRAIISGKPIKVVCLDTQVYSNTGGQACTSGFFGQISDMAQYGKAIQGKEEIRKELGYIAMAHRNTYVLQGTIANASHLMEGYIQGLQARRPALFNIYAPCMPEHGIGDDAARYQSKLAVESRAYPIFRYHPDNGKTVAECLDLEGNPAIDEDWPTYPLTYLDEDGNQATMDMPLTFADFALSEARFRKHFKQAPRDTWNDSMVHVAEFLKLEADDREGMYPYVWAVDKKGRLSRVLVSKSIITSTEDRLDFWTMLRGLAGVTEEVDVEALVQQAKSEAVQNVANALFQMAGISGGGAQVSLPSSGNGGGNGGGAQAALEAPAAEAAVATQEAPQDGGDWTPPFVDTGECTACGECVAVNAKVFGWNDAGKAVLLDPKAGTFKDVVKAAEKCAARCIKPGTPWDMSEKGVEKLIKRAAKFND